MHMATSLGVKWQPWSEIGPYRGVQAAVNGQEFAITYPRGAVVAGKHAANAKTADTQRVIEQCADAHLNRSRA
jgi:hypothetical protein